MLEKMHLAYYSPTYSTAKVTKYIAQNLAKELIEHDLTKNNISKINLSKNDLVIFAAPSYGGRIPNPMPQLLENFTADNTPAIAITVYGNRDYDDTLLELTDIITKQGFVTIAAAAFIAQHSLVTDIAADRPNPQDFDQMKNFSQKILAKLEQQATFAAITVKGNRPYKEFNTPPFTPYTTDKCINCNRCIELCPTQAIEQNNPYNTFADKCILCARCVRICPTQARLLPEQPMQMLSQHLKEICQTAKQPEFFL